MQTINKEQLEEKLNSIADKTLINTLPEDKFKEYKIPGSLNVPAELDDFAERVSMMVMKNKKADIILYCANEQCDSAAKAAARLDEAGFENVSHYIGGAEEWNALDKSS